MDTVAANRPLDSERRKFPRLSGNFQVDIVLLSGPKSGDAVSGRITNLSKEGVGLIMPAGLVIGTQLSLVIYVEDSDSLCVGNIIWSQEVGGVTHYGLKISDWSYIDPGIERQMPTIKN